MSNADSDEPTAGKPAAKTDDDDGSRAAETTPSSAPASAPAPVSAAGTITPSAAPAVKPPALAAPASKPSSALAAKAQDKATDKVTVTDKATDKVTVTDKATDKVTVTAKATDKVTVTDKDKDKDKATLELPPVPPGKSSSGSGGGMSKRAALILIALAVLAAVVAATWIAGSQNSQNYYLRCGASDIRAERGDSFPPWGEEPLRGPAWQPIEFVLSTPQCDDQAFTDRDALEAAYRRALLAQAERWLSTLRPEDSREPLDTVQRQLEQALLLSRSGDDPSQAARDQVGRLLGDVEYWRARDQLVSATKELDAAAQRLEAAVDKNPVHVRDATAWLELIRGLEGQLQAGPTGSPTEPTGRVEQPGTATPDRAGSPAHTAAEPAARQPGAQPGAQPSGDAGPDAAPGVFVPPESDAPPPSPSPSTTTTPGSGTLL